jgi:transcriptional regulator with XRE-family HTH domain
MPEHEQELIALGRAISRERHAKGLTIEALACKAGMSTGHLGVIERGRGNPRWDTLCALASALDMRLSTLLNHDLGVDAILDRHDERQLTPEEFEKHLGHLPTTARAENGWEWQGSRPGRRIRPTRALLCPCFGACRTLQAPPGNRDIVSSILPLCAGPRGPSAPSPPVRE